MNCSKDVKSLFFFVRELRSVHQEESARQEAGSANPGRDLSEGSGRHSVVGKATQAGRTSGGTAQGCVPASLFMGMACATLPHGVHMRDPGLPPPNAAAWTECLLPGDIRQFGDPWGEVYPWNVSSSI